MNSFAENVENDCLVVVKSTVPIGTNDRVEMYLKENVRDGIRVSVASNPEFLAQGTAVPDTLHASRIVIGVENKTFVSIFFKQHDPTLWKSIQTECRHGHRIWLPFIEMLIDLKKPFLENLHWIITEVVFQQFLLFVRFSVIA